MRKILPWIVTVLLALIIVPIPPAPGLLKYEVDTSLSVVLNYAQQSDLQFGTDVVFTYGPLGYLTFFFYSPHLAGLRLGVDFLLGLVVAAGVCSVGWRLKIVWRCLFFLIFAWVGANAWPRADLLINSGLLCWGLLCLLETGRRLRVAVVIFALLAVFSALAKFSFLILTTVSAVLIAADLVTRGKWRLAIALIAGVGGGFILGWVLTGQRLANLSAYFINSLAIVRGYNAALGMEGSDSVRQWGWILAVILPLLALTKAFTAFDAIERHQRWRQLWLFVWISFVAFTSWKHGWVRVDAFHVVMFLGFVPVFALALSALPSGNWRSRAAGQALALVCVSVGVVGLHSYNFPEIPESLIRPWRSLCSHAFTLMMPASYFDEMNTQIEVNQRDAQLPRLRRIIGTNSVDVFGQNSGYAVFNEMSYRPRPIFQSYAACNAALAELNEQFYLSEKAPEFVLFQFVSLDKKFVALEDARVLRHLLINYTPVATEGDFWLLKRKNKEPAQLTLLHEGDFELGHAIDLKPYGETNLWMEIELKPSFTGRLREFFSRPAIVRITARAEGESKKPLLLRRAPPSMLAAGFIASPLLTKIDDVLSVYAGDSVTRPATYSLELSPGDKVFWKSAAHYRIYKIENQMGRTINADDLSQLKAGEVAAILKSNASSGTNEFTLFRKRRWRPSNPPPGNASENLTYTGFLLLPFASVAGLVLFARKMKRRTRPIRFGWVLLGNGLVLLVLLSPVLPAGETYFRFYYDSTDSVAFTKVCERWVERYWHVNSVGSRDNVEYSPTLEPGKRRVSFVGDSFTAGHGVKNVEDRFANIFRRDHPELQIHVLANIGLDTGGELALLKRSVARGYQLNDVVLVYCLNDISELVPEQSAVYDQILAQIDQAGWLVQNSYFVNFYYHRYKTFRNPYLKDYFSLVLDAYRGEIWEKQKARLKELRDFVESHGGKLSVVTFPFLHSLGPNYKYAFVHQELDEAWRDLSVRHLDLLPVFKDLKPEQVTVNAFDAHPNEFAHKLAAEAIEKWWKEGR